MKIRDAVKIANIKLENSNIEDKNLKIKIVFANVLSKSKEYILIHDDEEIEEKKEREFFNKIDRLKNNEPIQYIINYQEFMGMDFFVNKDVLIPQPDTEILVEEVINVANNIKQKKIRILDLCTGSGAIAISISKILKEKAKVYASDVSEKALEVAIENSVRNNVEIEFFKSDIFKSIPKSNKFDIIVSNPPYIETQVIKNLPEEVKKEPKIALDGGQDGLVFYRKIIPEARKFLNENSVLAFEIGYNQKMLVEEILRASNYIDIYSKKDLAGNDRIIIAKN